MFFALRDERTLTMFKNGVLRKIFMSERKLEKMTMRDLYGFTPHPCYVYLNDQMQY
jgi:hypothetical protein